MRRASFLIILIAFACGSEPSHSEETIEGIEGKYFPGFPGTHFQHVVLGSSLFVAKTTLEEKGYHPKDDQSNHYVNEQHETEVILPDSDLLYNFKVFFFAEEDINNVSEFKELFSTNAVEEHASEEFSIYKFNSISQEFSITLFQQADFIRLNYELKSGV